MSEPVFAPGHWATGMLTGLSTTVDNRTSYSTGFQTDLFWFSLAPASCFCNFSMCLNLPPDKTVSPKYSESGEHGEKYM